VAADVVEVADVEGGKGFVRVDACGEGEEG